jgi:CheY-like chemotaxis protein
MGEVGRRGRVLLVDDEPFIGTSLRRLLGSTYEVVITSSAHEALERLAVDQRFDVILCDLRMPGMTGIDLHERLRVEHPELAARMVFVTGAGFTGEMRDFFMRVDNELVEKPFDPRALRALVQKFVDRKQP